MAPSAEPIDGEQVNHREHRENEKRRNITDIVHRVAYCLRVDVHEMDRSDFAENEVHSDRFRKMGLDAL